MLSCPSCSLPYSRGATACPRCGTPLERATQAAESHGCGMLALAGVAGFIGGLAGVFLSFQIWGQDKVLEGEAGVIWAFTIGFVPSLALALRLTRPKAGFVPESAPTSAARDAELSPRALAICALLLIAVGAYILWDFWTWERAGGSREIDARIAWLYLLFGKWGPAGLFWAPAGWLGWLAIRQGRARRRS